VLLRWIPLLTVFTVLFAAGCGGGEEQQGEQGSQQQEQADEKVQAQRLGSVEGVVRAVNVEKGRIFVSPKGEKAERVGFRPEDVIVTLGGEQVEPSAIQKGQRATVEYVVIEVKGKERNIARSIELESG
jgi:hypothetical protein